ncbi:MAG TPA: triose-phosphate isomerase [Ignavibacteriaceae bacterium]|nr:triose-phosphate isomerase [Ignavibacteriaceae bacterium]
MRRKVIAGNWKMHKDLNETQSLVTKLSNALSKEEVKCDVIICPPYTSLSEASSLIKDSVIKLGAQNMHFEEKGAFTGEVSTSMIKSVGCEYVILGHSERRTVFGENDEVINKKIKKALASNLKPIFCVGETLGERESGIMKDVIKRQVTDGLQQVSKGEMEKIIVAYEPVWAIGTGKTASPEQAQEVHVFIRELISEIFGNDTAENLIIQYGGSVKPDNAHELLSQNDIDGALVGGACLEADSFTAIIKSV